MEQKELFMTWCPHNQGNKEIKELAKKDFAA